MLEPHIIKNDTVQNKAENGNGRLKTVCAWCSKVISEGSGGTVSHGICPRCSDVVLADYRQELRNVVTARWRHESQ
jgi:hypothetical protein